MIDASPFGGDVAAGPLGAFDTSYDCEIFVSGRTAGVALRPVGPSSYSSDARRSPRVQASIVCAWPKAVDRPYLDPVRHALTLSISAAYIRKTTRNVDSQTIAELRVQSIEWDVVAQTITVEASSDEIVVIGQASDQAYTYATTDKITDAIQTVIGDAFPGESPSWVIESSLSGHTFPDAPDAGAWSSTQAYSVGDTVTVSSVTYICTQAHTNHTPPNATYWDVAPAAIVAVGEDRWKAVEDWAETLGAEIFHDGLGTWHIAVAPDYPKAKPSARVNSGPRGTLTGLKVTDTRTGWANEVIVRYSYTQKTTQHVDCGIAKTGLRPVSAVLVERQRKPINAERAAAHMLRRGLRRFHTVELAAAVAFWLQPWDTVTANGPGGYADRLLLDSVTFDLAAGDMTLVGQVPIYEHLPLITTSSTTTTP